MPIPVAAENDHMPNKHTHTSTHTHRHTASNTKCQREPRLHTGIGGHLDHLSLQQGQTHVRARAHTQKVTFAHIRCNYTNCAHAAHAYCDFLIHVYELEQTACVKVRFQVRNVPFSGITRTDDVRATLKGSLLESGSCSRCTQLARESPARRCECEC